MSTEAQLKSISNTELASGAQIPALKHRTVNNAIIEEMYAAQSRGDVLAGVQSALSLSGGDQVLVIRSGQAYLLDATDFGFVDALADLTDVSIPSPANDQVLAYNSAGNNWIAKDVNDLTSVVNITGTATTNQMVKFTGINSIGNTIVSDNGTIVNVAGDLSVDNNLTVGTINSGTSSDFVKGDGSLDSTDYQDISEKDQANGYAPLDSGAKIPLANLPDSILGQVSYQGTWAASTNTPTLANPPASTTKGEYYVASDDGTQFSIEFKTGDWIISNGSAWEKVDNTDAVTTVFGRLGNVVANAGDYASFYPPLSRTISAGTGLTGGGDLSANRTISHDNTSSQGSVNNSGGTVIQDVTLDGFGHVTGLASVDLDGRYVQSLTDTLDSVTDRGATTTNSITVGALESTGNLTLSGNTDKQIKMTSLTAWNYYLRSDSNDFTLDDGTTDFIKFNYGGGTAKTIGFMDGLAVVDKDGNISGNNLSGTNTGDQDLDSVTDRGATTTNTITVGNIILSNITPVEITKMVTILGNDGTLSTQDIPFNSNNNLDSVTTNGSSTSNTITIGGATINGNLTATGTGSFGESIYLTGTGGFDRFLWDTGGTNQVLIGADSTTFYLFAGNGSPTQTILVGNTSTALTRIIGVQTDIESPLSVTGNLTTTGGLTVANPSVFSREISIERYAIIKDGSGNTTGVFADSTYWTGSGHNLAIAAETGKSIDFFTNGSGTSRMSIDSSGNVLIGADSGDAFNNDSVLRLQKSGQRVFQQFKVDSDQEAQILFGNVVDDVRCAIVYEAANDNLILTTGDNDEAMRIDSAGNVGIGTDNPDTLLNLESASPVLRLAPTTQNNTSAIEFGVLNSGINGFAKIDVVNNVNYDTNMRFFTNAAGSTTQVERMCITSSGSVDITGNLTLSGYADRSIRLSSGTAYYYDIKAAGDDFQIIEAGNVRLTFDYSATKWIASANFDINGNLAVSGSGTFGSGLTVNGAQGLTVSGGGDFNADVDILGDLQVSGNLNVDGVLSKTSGSFRIDHPLEDKKDTHHLVHSFVEAPQADNIYRGKVELSQGQATVNLDEAGRMTEGTFVLLNGNIQCFTSNESGWAAIRGKVEGNILTIEAQDAECTDTISWLVIGERIDQHMIDTEWTDENGRVITEPLKKVEPTPEEEEEEATIIDNGQ